jgi:hypothetical protein
MTTYRRAALTLALIPVLTLGACAGRDSRQGGAGEGAASGIPGAGLTSAPPAGGDTTLTHEPDGAVGEEIEVENQRVLASRVEGWPGEGEFQPAEGNQYLTMQVRIEAIGPDAGTSPNLYTLLDAAGNAYSALETGGREPVLPTGDIAQGESVEGWVTFEIPQSPEAEPTWVQYQATFTTPIIIELFLEQPAGSGAATPAASGGTSPASPGMSPVASPVIPATSP